MTFCINHSFCKKTFHTYVCIQEIKNLSKNKFRRSIWELFQHIHRSSHTNKNVTQFSNDKVPLKENIHALTFINYYRSHFLLTLCSLCIAHTPNNYFISRGKLLFVREEQKSSCSMICRSTLCK